VVQTKVAEELKGHFVFGNFLSSSNILSVLRQYGKMW